MRLAYLIAAHDKPDQLEHLIRRLLSPATSDFVVLHLDAKSQLYREKSNYFAELMPGRVFVVPKPVSVHWGSPAQVIAAKLMLELALVHGFSFAHHISGVDWPVTTRSKMVETIRTKSADVFADIPSSEQPERMDAYWFPDRFIAQSQSEFFRYHGQRVFDRTSSKLNTLLQQLAPRSHPYGSWRKGSSWWSVSTRAAATLVQEIELMAKKGRMLFTACSDEHVTPSILAHFFADSMAEYHRYIIWDGGNHPRTLKAADLPAIHHSDAWFARKFDMNVDDSFLTAFPPFI